MKNVENCAKQVLVTYNGEEDYKQMTEAFILKGYSVKSNYQKDYVHAAFIDLERNEIFNANVTCAAAYVSSCGHNIAWEEFVTLLN